MAIDIVVPNLGESITEATVATWMKKEGDRVTADETLLELETDKATLEIPAPSAGVLSEIVVQEGEDVEVGALLGRISEDGAEAKEEEEAEAREEAAEPAAPIKEPEAKKTKAEEKAEEAEARRPAETEEGDGRRRAVGERRPEGAEVEAPPGLDPERVPRSGPGGAVTLDDLLEFFEEASQEAVERSGPAVRKLIADHGLDPSELPASGREGRITREDVVTFLEGSKEETVEREARPAKPGRPSGDRREERVKMSRLRRTVATRLKEAQNTAAILTTFNEVDMSGVMALRKRYREEFETRHGVRLGFMSFFVKAAVAALQEMPEVNAELDGDHIVYKHYYDIGIAVSTDAGLKVPVVRDAQRKTFAEIEKEIAALAEKARDGSLALEEMEGGTFSISNGGVFGSLLSTPILNPPQSAILGLHKIEERPVVAAGEIQVRPMMYVALSYDHRLIDGRESVTFLVKIKELIEDPRRLLLDV